MLVLLLCVLLPWVPVILLMWWVTHNKTRPLPLKGPGVKVFLLGGAGAIAVLIIFGIMLDLLNQAIEESGVLLFQLADEWLLAALPEEISKMLAVVLGTKMLKRLQYSTDVLLYAVLAALGFAFVENIVYAIGDLDLLVMSMRCFISIPAHVLYSCIIAVSYLQFLKTGAKIHIFKGVLLSSMIHGFGNFCKGMTTDSDIWFSYVYLLIGIPFVTIMTYVILFKIYKNFKLSFAALQARRAEDGNDIATVTNGHDNPFSLRPQGHAMTHRYCFMRLRNSIRQPCPSHPHPGTQSARFARHCGSPSHHVRPPQSG